MSFLFLDFSVTQRIRKSLLYLVINLQFSSSQQPEILAIMWITGTVLRTVIFLTLPEMTGVSNK